MVYEDDVVAISECVGKGRWRQKYGAEKANHEHTLPYEHRKEHHKMKAIPTAEAKAEVEAKVEAKAESKQLSENDPPPTERPNELYFHVHHVVMSCIELYCILFL